MIWSVFVAAPAVFILCSQDDRLNRRKADSLCREVQTTLPSYLIGHNLCDSHSFFGGIFITALNCQILSISRPVHYIIWLFRLVDLEQSTNKKKQVPALTKGLHCRKWMNNGQGVIKIEIYCLFLQHAVVCFRHGSPCVVFVPCLLC